MADDITVQQYINLVCERLILSTFVAPLGRIEQYVEGEMFNSISSHILEDLARTLCDTVFYNKKYVFGHIS